MIRSASLGGLFIGVLSALPIVGAANCCCCLWVVSGGALAAYLQVQQENRTLTGGEGAAVGALAGVIGAFVWLPLVVMIAVVMGPLQQAFLEELARNARDISPEAREILESIGGSRNPASYVVLFILQLVMGTLFAALGGVLSATYFKKEVPPALGGDWTPPLPPSNPF
ncbi:MAG TPA: hypothetical protein VFD69_17750 [Vicinamibacterales bacterium]|nr:hypothetical protein [Vicinamibacterales bacterium]